MAAQGVTAIIGADGVGVRDAPRLSNEHGVSAPFELLKEVVSYTLRNEGERGNGTEVGEGGQGNNSNLGPETDLGEGGSGKRYAAISGGISRSGVTGRLPGRLVGTDGRTREASKVDDGKCEIATPASDDDIGSHAGCASESGTAESTDSDDDNWIIGGAGQGKFPPNLKLFILCS